MFDLNNSFPMFLMLMNGQVDHRYILAFMIYYLIKTYWLTISNWFKTEKSITIKLVNDSNSFEKSYVSDNFLLVKKVNWYLKKIVDIEQYKTLYYEEYKSMSINVPTKPIFLKTPYDGIKINFNVHTNNNTSLEMVVSANSIKRIRKFFDIAIKKYDKYQKTKLENEKNCQHYVSIDRIQIQSSCLNVNKTKENSILPKQVENKIYNNIDTFLKSKKRYKKLGIPYKKSFLIHGRPGTGKTSLAYALSNYFNIPLIKMVKSNFESNRFQFILNKIPKKSLILIDECDEVFKLDENNNNNTDTIDNTKQNIGNNLKRSTILNILDGYVGFKGCILIFTTNYYDKIDPAIVRPGRIDEVIELKECTKEQAIRILNLYSDFEFETIENPKTGKEIQYYPTSAELINRIILPNSDNKNKIIEELVKYDK